MVLLVFLPIGVKIALGVLTAAAPAGSALYFCNGRGGTDSSDSNGQVERERESSPSGKAVRAGISWGGGEGGIPSETEESLGIGGEGGSSACHSVLGEVRNQHQVYSKIRACFAIALFCHVPKQLFF